MAFEKWLWRQPIIQLLDVSSFERLVQLYTKPACTAFWTLVWNPRADAIRMHGRHPA